MTANRATPRTLPAAGWAPAVPKSYNGYAWARPSKDYRPTATEFKPSYLGAGSIFTRSVAAMPLATKSADYAAWMLANVDWGGGFGPTSVNTSVFGTHPIQTHVVDSRLTSSQAYITGAGLGSAGTLMNQVLSGWVPWPNYPLSL